MPNVFEWSHADEWSLDRIISYMEETREESWTINVVRTLSGKNCLFGHLHEMGGGDEKFGGSNLMDWFEAAFATSYMVYPVNDGKNPRYKQPTPKQRVIAYLCDIRDGRQKTTDQLINEYVATLN